MDSFHFLHDTTTGKLSDGRFGPHGEVPAGFETVATDLHEIPPWFPHHAVFESGKLKEMSEAEKTGADAERSREAKLARLRGNEVTHALLRRQARAEGKTVEELENELVAEMEG